MKKILILMLALVMVFALASCGGDKTDDTKNDDVTETPDTLQVMTYDEFVAAELDAKVTVEVYVQATQGWYHNDKSGKDVITVYAADEDGGYFIYDMECAQADAEKLVPGAKILVTGYKAEWSGEIEIVDATFEFVEDAPYIAEPIDVTELLGTDALIDYQNQLVSFSGLTFVSLEYKNGSRGNDIYVKFSYNGAEYDFCVESYLTGPDSETYLAVEALQVGDLVNVEGFLYWYNGVNTHITAVDYAVMTYDEYAAAELNSKVTVEVYVQATQGWYHNSNTNKDVITVYAADKDGGYFIYDMECSQADSANLVPGAKIRVTGYKAEWSGEVEIVDATFELLEADPYIATPLDVTALLGTDELVNYQNRLVSFRNLTFVSLEYKGGSRGNDIYVTFSYNGATYDFCVESYLTGPDTALYQSIEELQEGEVVYEIIGFLDWYNGPNPHIVGKSKPMN